MTLIPNTLFVGKVCILLDRVHSTQTYLTELCAKSRPFDGTAILSYHQTSGYGQRQREWHTGEGLNIALSVLFNTIKVPVAQQFLLSMAMALAVKTAVAQMIDAYVSIKWPNDIIVNQKKIAGLLIQTQLQHLKITQAIVGCGLNVNQLQFPDDLNHATSLALEGHRQFDLDDTAKILLENIEKQFLRLSSGPSEIIKDYNQALYQINQPVSIAFPSGDVSTAQLIGVDATGKLEVAMEGNVYSYQHGEVKLLFDPPYPQNKQ